MHSTYIRIPRDYKTANLLSFVFPNAKAIIHTSLRLHNPDTDLMNIICKHWLNIPVAALFQYCLQGFTVEGGGEDGALCMHKPLQFAVGRGERGEGE